MNSMNTKNIISCGINNNMFIISNNIIITMGSTTWRLVCPCATWRLGCHSQSSLLPRPVPQVVLGSAPHDWATLTLGGARVFPSVTWRWGCHSQSGLLPRPKSQVVLGSASLQGRAAHAPCGSQFAPRKGQAAEAPAVLAWATSSARYLWPAAPPKLVLVIFSLTIHSMSNAPQQKDNPTTPPLSLQLFVSRAGLPLHCSNSQCSEFR